MNLGKLKGSQFEVWISYPSVGLSQFMTFVSKKLFFYLQNFLMNRKRRFELT
jgi:hypothetical protein